MRKVYLISFLIFFALIIGILIFHITSKTHIDSEKSYGLLEMWYYFLASAGSIFTLFAVIVALFNNEIRKLFFRAKCIVKIEELQEELQDLFSDDENLRAQSYYCRFNIKNIGNQAVEDCRLVLTDLKYKGEKKNNFRDVKITPNKNNIFWGYPMIEETTIYSGETKRVTVFKIYPKKTGEGTPDKNTTHQQFIQIMGCHFNENTNKNGTWIATYNLRNKRSILCQFDVEIFWSGKWHNRLSEMKNEVSINKK